MVAAGRLRMSALLVFGLTLSASHAFGALMNPGDIAFIGFNEDGSDDFAIVLLAAPFVVLAVLIAVLIVYLGNRTK